MIEHVKYGIHKKVRSYLLLKDIKMLFIQWLSVGNLIVALILAIFRFSSTWLNRLLFVILHSDKKFRPENLMTDLFCSLLITSHSHYR